MKTCYLKLTVLLTICFCTISKSQIQIPPSFFGLNLWFTDYKNAPFGSMPNLLTSTQWGACSATGAKTIRVGGIAFTVDRKLPGESPVYPRTVRGTGTNTFEVVNPAGYVKIVDDCRANGFEPMIEVPFDDRSKMRSIEEQAM